MTDKQLKNADFERKLSALREEAETSGLPAVHLILHMLHACYLERMEKDFATHCCEFSTMRLGMQEAEAMPQSAQEDDGA